MVDHTSMYFSGHQMTVPMGRSPSEQVSTGFQSWSPDVTSSRGIDKI